jgi:hypothetical protein
MGRKLRRLIAEGKVVSHKDLHRPETPEPTEDSDPPLHQPQQTTNGRRPSRRAKERQERRRQNQIALAEQQLARHPHDQHAQRRLAALLASDGPIEPQTGRPQGKSKGLTSKLPTHPDLLQKYKSDDWDLLENLRQTLIRRGLVEHRISPTEAIQRAIDDVTLDYLALRHYIDQRVDSPKEQQDHPLTDRLHYLREAMVRYSTFATQYKLAEQQQKVSEARTALLAYSLKEVLSKLGIDDETVAQVPRLLIAHLAQQANNGERGNPLSKTAQLDETKAEALVEILHNDSEVVILEEDGTPVDIQHDAPAPQADTESVRG